MLYPAIHRLTTTRIPEKHNSRTSKSCVKAMFSIAPAQRPRIAGGVVISRWVSCFLRVHIDRFVVF